MPSIFPLLMSGVALSAAATDLCAGTYDGNYYDVSAMASKDDYSFTTSMGISFSWNFCKTIDAAKFQCKENAGKVTAVATVNPICQELALADSKGEFGPIATAPNGVEATSAAQGVAITFSNTDKDTGVCEKSTGDKWSFTVNLLCDKTATENFQATEGGSLSNCKYYVNMKSIYGCVGEASALSIGSILMIVVAVGIFLYFVVGCIVMRKKFGTTGMKESIPFVEFWCGLPGLVKDGCAFTALKCKACTNKCRGGGGDTGGDYDDI